VPPVFIEVCRDTRVARAVYDWLADGKGAAAAPPWFRNAPGQEVTVRIDSRVVEDMEAGGTQDETRRLRFILDTIGKKTWPGDKVPEEWAELVRRHNAKAEEEGPAAGAGSGLATGAGDGVGYRWLDERVPPGRDIRCIVSVAMLTEGWDANTVTHIVGLRLGLRIPYRKQGVPAHYYPDFIAVLATGLTLLIEIKGRYADDADLKARAAQRWVAAVNRCGEHGSWRYLVITEPPKLMLELDRLTGSTREAKELVLG
jgi:hypothetical protein